MVAVLKRFIEDVRVNITYCRSLVVSLVVSTVGRALRL